MLPESLSQEIDALVPRVREIRHDLHKHPELGFEEKRTQQVVREFLEQHGYKPRTSAETGLIAELNPGSNAPMIALRADMDCLPIQEDMDLPYKSVHPGKSHKCGHDGHTAILLGVAALLAKHRALFPGNVRLVFQPAEEGVRGGGAKVMVAEGAMEGVREVYGLHNWPAWPKGEVRVQPGPMLAQVHSFFIDIEGVGGHGSQPQLTRDPIVAAAHLIVSLQTVVARGLGYEGGAVVSVGAIHSGTADNIIPGALQMKGTIRTFRESVRNRVLERVREICTGVGSTFGVKVDLRVIEGYPVTMNDPSCADVVARVARSVLGPKAVRTDDLPMAGGEDFSYFARAVPGAYFFLGSGEPGKPAHVCHHPEFDFNDAVLPIGMRMFLGILLDRLPALAGQRG
jgi:amidohydrolase